MASVTLKGIEKRYGSTKVIHGVDLDVSDGQFVVLVGPSGCGKSTILRMIAGLEEISAGTLMIDDDVVNNMAPKQRDVAMVFQNYALYPHKTVYHNMGFGLKLRKAPKAEIDKRVRHAAEILGLTSELQRYPRQLSGGQRQRVAMGRAIVRDPKVFLFDEPLSNLDAKLRIKMRTEIRSLHEELKTTSIYVTHDQIEAMTMADKIVVLRDGIVEQIGTPLDLYDQPANVFVAGFIGSPPMNLIEGRVTNGGGAMAVEVAGGGRLPLRPGAAEVGRRVFYGVRPEDVTVADEGVEAVVDVVEPLGAQTLVFAKFAGHEVSLMAPKRFDLEHGAPVKLVMDLDDVLLFDAESGARITAHGTT